MADAVASQTIMNGERRVIMKFTNTSDATGEAAVTKVDASALDANLTDFKITKIIYSTHGMAVQILWGATADVVAWTLPQDHSGCLDFNGFGGLVNNAGSGKTGNIKFTTLGATANDTYSIVLEMTKRG